jgi:RNA polymerase sigma-70 factor (ECF subfamily)
LSRQHDSVIVELITQYQGETRAYILSLLCRWADTQDVLQETNMILWERRANAPEPRGFLPWAAKITYYQVSTYRKRHQRSRLFFSEELICALAAVDSESPASGVVRVEAFEQCMRQLPPECAELLAQRHYAQRSIEEFAAEVGRTSQVVSQSLYRIRKRLLECIQTRLRASERGLG